MWRSYLKRWLRLKEYCCLEVELLRGLCRVSSREAIDLILLGNKKGKYSLNSRGVESLCIDIKVVVSFSEDPDLKGRSRKSQNVFEERIFIKDQHVPATDGAVPSFLLLLLLGSSLVALLPNLLGFWDWDDSWHDLNRF